MDRRNEESERWPGPRAVLHLDMDAFFAAVEILDNPTLAGKPVIVGGTAQGHGVVSTASYEARRFGVRSAMSAAQAVKLCPHGIFLPPRMGRYAAVSRTVFAALGEFTPLVEPVSVDEAFLDLTGIERLHGHPLRAAQAIKDLVRQRTGGLSSSMGLAPNKFLAKVASDLEKPDGLVAVPPGRVMEFLAPLPVERIWGVGPRTAEALHALGLRRIGDLQKVPEGALGTTLGVEAGRHIERLARGLDERPVEDGGLARSVSSETTLETFLAPGEKAAIDRVLLALSEDVAARLRALPARARCIVLKVRDDRFHTVTRSSTLESPTDLTDEVFERARSLFRERVEMRGRVRLLGVSASELLFGAAVQLDLFAGEGRRRAARVESAMDRIREKLGEGSIQRGSLVDAPLPRPPADPSGD